MALDEVTVQIVQVDRPANGWCDSGHSWPEDATWQKLPDAGPEQIVYFKVRARGHQGTYCEPCLILAQNLAAVRQKARAEGL